MSKEQLLYIMKYEMYGEHWQMCSIFLCSIENAIIELCFEEYIRLG